MNCDLYNRKFTKFMPCLFADANNPALSFLRISANASKGISLSQIRVQN